MKNMMTSFKRYVHIPWDTIILTYFDNKSVSTENISFVQQASHCRKRCPMVFRMPRLELIWLQTPISKRMCINWVSCFDAFFMILDVCFAIEALLDPLTSALVLDKTTGQQQLKVNTGILAPQAQLGATIGTN